MGVDITYVSDYVDNHQQMEIDLKVMKIKLVVKKLNLIKIN
jgi:hypothetical protein